MISYLKRRISWPTLHGLGLKVRVNALLSLSDTREVR